MIICVYGKYIIFAVLNDKNMTAIELEAQKALLAKEILSIEDVDLLLSLQLAFEKILKDEKKKNCQDAIIKSIDFGLKDVKAGRTRPVEELLKELR